MWKGRAPLAVRIFIPAGVALIGTLIVLAAAEATEAVLIRTGFFFPLEAAKEASAIWRRASVAVRMPASGTFTARNPLPFFLFSVSLPLTKTLEGDAGVVGVIGVGAGGGPGADGGVLVGKPAPNAPPPPPRPRWRSAGPRSGRRRR